MNWTKEMPQVEGQYWIRDNEGVTAGTIFIREVGEGFECVPHLWGGYFWPEALPQCPPFEKSKATP